MVFDFRSLGIPEHARPLAKLLHDYDPNLFLERLPNGHPWLLDNPDKPYAVIHRSPSLGEYIIESYHESMLDHRVFANTVFGDANRHNFDFAEFDPVAASFLLLKAREKEDEVEAGNDMMDFHQRMLNDTGKRVFS